MNEKKIDKLALLSLVVGIILSLPGLFAWLGIPPKDTVGPLGYYGVPCVGAVIAGLAYYRLLLFFRELRRIKAAFQKMHLVSHTFRNAVHELIQRKNKADPTHDKKYEQDQEKKVLNDVCDICSDIFKDVTGDRSLTCVRLISVTHENPTCFLNGHCNNHTTVNRGLTFDVVIDQHTRYQSVKNLHTWPTTLHYFNADVTKDSQYRDPNYAVEPYRSTIVVPIRGVSEPKEFLGFLKVQTKKPSRLNGNWHVELLAMFADQIFSYLDCSRTIRENLQG